MADKEIKVEEKHEEVEHSEPKVVVTDDKKNRRGLIITLSIAGLVFLGLLIGGTVWLFNSAAQQRLARDRPGFGNSMTTRFDTTPGYGYGRSIQTEVTDDKVTTTVYTYQTGVVIAVNSDNIVIAGNGKQTTIKTNSSTKYTDDVKPAANDTVVIAGTTDDGTTTATEIRVANRS